MCLLQAMDQKVIHNSNVSGLLVKIIQDQSDIVHP